MENVLENNYFLDGSEKIPKDWRKKIVDIVEVFKNRNLEKLNEIEDIEYIELEHAQDILSNLDSCDLSLVSLPNETWESSSCIYFGDGWQVFIDLYTKEEGRSDFILTFVVMKNGPNLIFTLDNIYVP